MLFHNGWLLTAQRHARDNRLGAGRDPNGRHPDPDHRLLAFGTRRSGRGRISQAAQGDDTMTPSGKVKLIQHEGEVLHGYTDSEGFLTIGIGHLIDQRRGGGISRKVSRILFDDDLAEAEADCAQAFNFWHRLDDIRKDVVVMLRFNMGLKGLKTFRLMLKAIDEGEWSEAAWQLSNSLWAKQVQRERMIDLCTALETGEWRNNLV